LFSVDRVAGRDLVAGQDRVAEGQVDQVDPVEVGIVADEIKPEIEGANVEEETGIEEMDLTVVVVVAKMDEEDEGMIMGVREATRTVVNKNKRPQSLGKPALWSKWIWRRVAPSTSIRFST
jgi:hypothetical protein